METSFNNFGVNFPAVPPNNYFHLQTGTESKPLRLNGLLYLVTMWDKFTLNYYINLEYLAKTANYNKSSSDPMTFMKQLKYNDNYESLNNKICVYGFVPPYDTLQQNFEQNFRKNNR